MRLRPALALGFLVLALVLLAWLWTLPLTATVMTYAPPCPGLYGCEPPPSFESMAHPNRDSLVSHAP